MNPDLDSLANRMAWIRDYIVGSDVIVIRLFVILMSLPVSLANPHQN